MGFFDESRSNDESRIDSTIIEKLFPEGDSERAGVLTSIKAILGKKILDVEIIQLFSDLVVGCSANVSPDKLRIRTQVKFPSFDNDLAVYRAIAFTQLHLKLPTFFLDKEPNKQMVYSMAKIYVTNDKFIAKNNRKPDSYDQNPQYGLSPDVPILVWGIETVNDYLGRLRDSANNPITWYRQESVSSETVFGNSDIYVLSNTNNETLGRIYINIYSHKEPKRAPHGFILASPMPSTERLKIDELLSKNEIVVENDTANLLISDPEDVKDPEDDSSSILCNNCQSLIKIDNKFCVYCGALVIPDKQDENLKLEQEDQHFELKEELDIKILPITPGSNSTRADTVQTQSFKCNSCGAPYEESANFCSVCGTKLYEDKKEIIEQQQESANYSICKNCNTQNKIWSSYCEICGKPLTNGKVGIEKPSKRHISKAVYLAVIISTLIISYIGVNYYLEYRADEEAKRIKEEYRQAKIDAALKDPSLYWYVNFSSPTNDHTYSTRTASNYHTGSYIDNVKCVIVGIQVIKSSNSIYFLDDSIDGGKINLKSLDFTLNGLHPTIDTGVNVCWRAYRDFDIVSSYDFTLYNTQTANFLFIIDLRSQNSNEFLWRNKTITTLKGLFD